MGTYNGRRGVSQYLRDVESGHSHDAPTTDETYGVEGDDLAMFTNTQFFDFDSGQNTDYNARPSKQDAAEARRQDDLTSPGSVVGDFSSLEFSMPGDFHLGEYGSAYTSPTIPTFSEALGNLPPIQPNHQPVYPPPPPQHQANYSGQPPRIGEKHKGADTPHAHPQSSRSLSFEEASRVAAEEDKRRRNTAASARFRVKKKQREQALEKSAKEMTDKVTILEGRIQQLETENKWLKNLVMEKNGGSEEMIKLWKELGSKDTDAKTRDSITAAAAAASDAKASKA